MDKVDLILTHEPVSSQDLDNALRRFQLTSDLLTAGQPVLRAADPSSARVLATLIEAHGGRAEARPHKPAVPRPSAPNLSAIRQSGAFPQVPRRSTATTPFGGVKPVRSNAPTPNSGAHNVRRPEYPTPTSGEHKVRASNPTPSGTVPAVRASNPTPSGTVPAVRAPQPHPPPRAIPPSSGNFFDPDVFAPRQEQNAEATSAVDFFGDPLDAEGRPELREPGRRPLPSGHTASRPDWLTGVGPSLVTQAIKPGQLAPPPPEEAGQAPPTELDIETSYGGPRWQASHIPRDDIAEDIADSHAAAVGKKRREVINPGAPRAAASSGLELDFTDSGPWRSVDDDAQRRREAADSGLDIEAVPESRVRHPGHAPSHRGTDPRFAASPHAAAAATQGSPRAQSRPRQAAVVAQAVAIQRPTYTEAPFDGFFPSIPEALLLPLRGPAWSWYIRIALLTIAGAFVSVFASFLLLFGLIIILIFSAAILAINVHFFTSCLGAAAHGSGDPGAVPELFGDFKASLVFPGLSMIIFLGLTMAPAALLAANASSPGQLAAQTPAIIALAILPLLYFPAGLALVAADGNPFALWNVPRGVTAILRAPGLYAAALGIAIVISFVPGLLALVIAGLHSALGLTVAATILTVLISLVGGTWTVGVAGALLGHMAREVPGIWD